jgi:hypothetical protein
MNAFESWIAAARAVPIEREIERRLPAKIGTSVMKNPSSASSLRNWA